VIDELGRIKLSESDWLNLATWKRRGLANRHDAKRLRAIAAPAISVASDALTERPGETGARSAAAVLEPHFGPRHAAALVLRGSPAFDYDPMVDAWVLGTPIGQLPRDPHAV